VLKDPHHKSVNQLPSASFNWQHHGKFAHKVVSCSIIQASQDVLCIRLRHSCKLLGQGIDKPFPSVGGCAF
jgi:hypothetical protein